MWKKHHKILKKIWVIIGCAAALLLKPLSVEASEEIPKHIHIVFDNSKSMVGNGNPDLANATYALQVLLAMLDEKDTATIYLVSECSTPYSAEEYEQILHDNVDRIVWNNNNEEDANSKAVEILNRDLAENTYFNTVMQALNCFNEEDISGEKWLVVLTDGEYEDWNIDSKKELSSIIDNVSGILEDEKYEDINIIHYSFGKEDYYNSTKEKNGRVTYYPQPSGGYNNDEMLYTMIQIGNQIFARQKLEVERNRNRYTFTAETPIKKIIAFAQNIMTERGQEIAITPEFDVISVKEIQVQTISEWPGNGSDEENVNSDCTYYAGTQYIGKLETYDFSGYSNFLEAGEYIITIENEDTTAFEIYYEPDIGMRLVLEEQNGNRIAIDSSASDPQKIPSGEYKAFIELYNPQTQEALAKDGVIAGETKYTVSISDENNLLVNGNAADHWEGSLDVGNYTISATADIFAGLTKNMEVQVSVSDSLRDIRAELMVPADGINMEEPGTEGNALMLKMFNREEVLSDEYKELVEVTILNQETSYYQYRLEMIDDGWLLWPEKNLKNRGGDDKASGLKELQLEIKLQVDGIEMEPIILEETIFYHGNPFGVSFRCGWKDHINFGRYILAKYNIFPIYIEPRVNNEDINWSVIDLTEMTPSISGDEQSDFVIQVTEDGRKWKVIPQASLRELLTSKSSRNCSQEVTVGASMMRYEQEGSGTKTIEIDMKMLLAEPVLFILIMIMIGYCLMVQLFKTIRRINFRGIKVSVDLNIGSSYIVNGKASRHWLYNLFVPNKSKLSVQLNEIDGGESQKITFKCRAGGICTISNLKECLNFSEMKINGNIVRKGDMYDVANDMSIVIEKDPNKEILLYKR